MGLDFPVFQGGSEYRAGQSWLQAAYDGQQIVAFLPQDSVFRMKGRLFALLASTSIYPAVQPDVHGLACLVTGFGKRAAVWCVPALRVPLVHSLINHFRQKSKNPHGLHGAEASL